MTTGLRNVHLSRRRLLGRTMGVAAVVVLQACSSTPTTPTAAPSASQSSAQTSPTQVVAPNQLAASTQAAAPSTAATVAPPTPAVAPTAASQTAPAQAAASQAPATIRVMDRPSPDYVKFINTWIAQYEKNNPSIKIEFNPRPTDFSPVTAAMAAGAAPDVLALFGEWYRTYQEKGQLLEIDQYIKATMSADDIADFAKGQYQGMNYKGKQLGIPYYANLNMMMYNKNALTEAKIEKPANNWTLDDMLSYAQKLTKRNGNTVQRWGFDTDFTLFFYRPISFVWARCGQINDPSDITKFTFTKPETIAAIQWIHDLPWKYHVASVTAADLGGLTPIAGFWANKAGLYFDGNYLFENVPAGLPFDWDIVPPPQGNCGIGQRTATDGYAIYGRTKYPDQSWAVVKDLTSPSVMTMRQTMVRLLASRKSVAAFWPKVYPDKNLASLLATMDEAQPDPAGLWELSDEVSNLINPTLQQMLILNKISVPDACAKMQADVTKLYQQKLH